MAGPILTLPLRCPFRVQQARLRPTLLGRPSGPAGRSAGLQPSAAGGFPGPEPASLPNAVPAAVSSAPTTQEPAPLSRAAAVAAALTVAAAIDVAEAGDPVPGPSSGSAGHRRRPAPQAANSGAVLERETTLSNHLLDVIIAGCFLCGAAAILGACLQSGVKDAADIFGARLQGAADIHGARLQSGLKDAAAIHGACLQGGLKDIAEILYKRREDRITSMTVGMFFGIAFAAVMNIFTEQRRSR